MPDTRLGTDATRELETMSVLDLSNLVKALEERFGVSAAAAAVPLPSASAKVSLGRFKDLSVNRHRRAVQKLTAVLRQIADLKLRQRTILDRDMEDLLAAQSAGLNLDMVPLIRYLPVRVYLADGDKSDLIEVALKRFLDSLGLIAVSRHYAERGSWWSKLVAKTKEPATREVLVDSLEKGRRALEVQYLQKAQSEVDKNQAEAAAALIAAIKDESAAVLQLGSIVVMKYKNESGASQTIARSLSQRELILIEKHPDLLKRPEALLLELGTLAVPRIESAPSAVADVITAEQPPPPETERPRLIASGDGTA